jgi:hypothetical protein
MDSNERIAAREAAYRARCEAEGFWMSVDERVDAETAALLLGDVTSATLRNYRYSGTGPPFYRMGGRRGRITYWIRDLATHVETGREDFCTECHQKSQQIIR